MQALANEILQVLGPVLGGFIAAGPGWRWTFWLLGIFGGVVGVTALAIMRETHPKVILERKAAHLRATTGHPHLQSKLAGKPLAPGQVILQILIRPTMLLFQSPILFVISLYVALVFGVMYLLFTTFPSVFEGQYGFNTSISGLVYLGLGVALVASMLLFNVLNGRVQAARMRADGTQQPRPEYRLLLMIWFSPCVGLGLIIYGWTAHYRVHWIVPIIGTVFMGFGAFFVIVSVANNHTDGTDADKRMPRCPRSSTWLMSLDLKQLPLLWVLTIYCVTFRVHSCHSPGPPCTIA